MKQRTSASSCESLHGGNVQTPLWGFDRGASSFFVVCPRIRRLSAGCDYLSNSLVMYDVLIAIFVRELLYAFFSGGEICCVALLSKLIRFPVGGKYRAAG